MTDKRIRELVELWRGRLRLDHWTLTVSFDETNDEDASCYAETQPSKHYDDAKIVFYRKPLATLDDRGVETTVVHELLHCAHRDVEAIVDLLDGQVHRDVETVLTESFRHAVEGFVDRTAAIIVAAYAAP